MPQACFIGLLVAFILQVAANCLTPIWSIYTHMIGGTVRSAGIAILIFTWGTAIFSIITPLINAKLKMSNAFLLIFGILLSNLAIVSYFFICDIYIFYIAQLLLALGAGIQIPPFYVIYERNITLKNRSIAWGALDSVFYFAIGFGSFVSA